VDNRSTSEMTVGVERGEIFKNPWALATRSEREIRPAVIPRHLGERDHARLKRAALEARDALNEAAAAATAAAVRALSYAEVLDEALAILAGADDVPVTLRAPALPIEAEMLSPREREVLALVAEGRTNKAIADALYVSPNTIKTHVSSLFNKLDAHNRSELAVIAARQGWH
jgi:DNA-binding NarL/FixJ family response regulator